MTQKWSLLSAAFAATLAVIASGCASSPELEKYSRREIDRPYTLPRGVTNWHIPTIMGYVKDDSSSTTIPPITVPLIWEQSLSDDWNLIWAPIPLGIAHQLSNSETDRLGFSVLTGFSYGSEQGFRLSPTLSFSYRHRFSHKLALDLTPTVTPDIPFKSGQDFRWSAEVSSGPLFQLSDTFSLKPNVSFGFAHGRASLTNATFDNLELENQTTFTMGLGVASVWSIGRQWDFRPAYAYSGFGAKNGYQSHIGILEFVHFW